MVLQERFNNTKFVHEGVGEIIGTFIKHMPVLSEKKTGHLMKGVALELARAFPADQKAIYLLFEPVEKVDRRRQKVPVVLVNTQKHKEDTVIIDGGCDDCGDDPLIVTTSKKKTKSQVLIVPAASSQQTLPASAYEDESDSMHAKADEHVKLDAQGNVTNTIKSGTPMEVLEVQPTGAGDIAKNMGVGVNEAYEAAKANGVDEDNPDVSPALVKDMTAAKPEPVEVGYNMWNDANKWPDVVEAIGADADLLWDFIVDNVGQHALDDSETKLPVLAKVILAEILLRRRGKKS